MINSRLKVARMRANKTQKEVAEVLGISYRTYGDFENGRRIFTQEQIMKLATYYGVTTDYLMGRDLYQNDPRDDMATYKIAKTNEEIELLDLFRRISPYLQDLLLENARSWAKGVGGAYAANRKHLHKKH